MGCSASESQYTPKETLILFSSSFPHSLVMFNFATPFNAKLLGTFFVGNTWCDRNDALTSGGRDSALPSIQTPESVKLAILYTVFRSLLSNAIAIGLCLQPEIQLPGNDLSHAACTNFHKHLGMSFLTMQHSSISDGVLCPGQQPADQ